jgi:hypothetical protein
MSPNRYLTTGRPIVGVPMIDKGGVDGLVLFSQFSTSTLSATLQLGRNPFVLKVYGLNPGETVTLFNYYAPTDTLSVFQMDGRSVVLDSDNTTSVLSLAGNYKLLFNGVLGDLIVTATELDEGRVLGDVTAASLRSQMVLPNPYLGSGLLNNLSQKAQVTDMPWVYRVYGLRTGDTIDVLNSTTQAGVETTELYKPEGVPSQFNDTSNTLVLGTAGTYRFQLNGDPAGVLLIGNESPILYVDPYSAEQAQAAAAAAAASAAAAAASAAAAAAGGGLIPLVARQDLTYYNVVAVADGEAYYPDLTNPQDVENIIGLSTNAASIGTVVNVAIEGQYSESMWNWVPGFIYCGTNGALTQTVPLTGAIVRVAKAINPTTIEAGISLAILR